MTGMPKPVNADRSLLIVDDDELFRLRLARAMAKRGFDVATAASGASGVVEAETHRPAFAVVDLRLADADEVEQALLANELARPAPPERPMSPERVRREHFQRIFELRQRNVSEAAGRLTMHRRTLQRILAKRSPQ
jgi:two-component system response regulator RegA